MRGQSQLPHYTGEAGLPGQRLGPERARGNGGVQPFLGGHSGHSVAECCVPLCPPGPSSADGSVGPVRRRLARCPPRLTWPCPRAQAGRDSGDGKGDPCPARRKEARAGAPSPASCTGDAGARWDGGGATGRRGRERGLSPGDSSGTGLSAQGSFEKHASILFKQTAGTWVSSQLGPVS